MAFNQSLTTNHPVGTTNPRDLDTIIKDQVKEAFRERLNVDHDFSISGNKVDGTNVGTHRKVTFTVPLGSAPSVASGQCQVYGRTVSGRVELFHKNYDGAEIQLTRNGVLNVNAAALVGLFDNTTITQSGGLLAVKDGGVSRVKLNADVVDNATLENVAGGIRVKDGGLGESKLSAASVSASKIKLPGRGSGATLVGIPIMATGNYAGDGSSNRIINAFGTGVTVREVLIAKNNGEKIIAFMWNPSTGEQIAWDQATNTEYSTDAVRFSGNTFIVGGTHTNKAPDPVTHYYYWIAYGTWNP